MPRKPTTVLVMRDYSPLSSRHWFTARVASVRPAGKHSLRLELAIVSEPLQTGRSVVHELPAILAPNSPLSVLLAEGFGIHLAENEAFDLTTLVGRVVELRFAKKLDGQDQTIVAIRCYEESMRPGLPTKTSAAQDAGGDRGLG